MAPAALDPADVERVRRDRAVRLLFESDEICVGEFHCSPRDWRWSSENCADEGHFVVFPGTTVQIAPAGSEPVVTDQNQVMLYNRDQTYHRRLVDPRGDHCVFLLVAAGLLSEVLPGAETQSGFRFPVTHGPVRASAYLLQRLLVRGLRTEPAPSNDRMQLEEAFYLLLGRVLTDALCLRHVRAAREQTERMHAGVVEDTKLLLASRLGENLSLGEIARAVFTSGFHLARIFRRHTGFGIHEYRDQLRLRLALDRLFDPSTELSSLAHELGYASHSHFTSSFRRVFGAAPSAFRKRSSAAEHRSLYETLARRRAASVPVTRIVGASFTSNQGGTMATKAIPEGYHTLTPYLAVHDAAKAIEYYKKAFGAKERVRMEAPGGTIGHAELEIGDSLVMLSDPFPQANTKPPTELGGTSASVFMYVEDVDAVVKQAVDAGATVTMEVADQFWGDRFGTVSDPFGHTWSIATHVEDLSPEEIAERGKAAMAAMSS